MSWYNYWQAKKAMAKKALLPPPPVLTNAQKQALRDEVERRVSLCLNEWAVEWNACVQTRKSDITAARIAKGFTTLLTRHYHKTWNVFMDMTTDEVCLVIDDGIDRRVLAADRITKNMI